MRVLMVTPRLPQAGRPATTAFISRQIASLKARRIDVDVMEVSEGTGLAYLKAAFRLHRRARASDLVHAHYGFCGWVARCQLSRPVVVSFLGSDLIDFPSRRRRTALRRRAELVSNRLLARLVDRVIVKSDQMAAIVASARPLVIANGVDLSEFAPVPRAEAREQLGWPADGRYVLFPGNPEKTRKGFPLARAAVAEASRRLGQELELVALAEIEPDRVPMIMNACDAMVLTSLAEGSPNVVKEAMACNLPVVSVPVGDVELLLEGVLRCRVAPREPEALGATLAAVLDEAAPSDGRQALVRKGLDACAVAGRIVAVYEDVRAGRSLAASPSSAPG